MPARRDPYSDAYARAIRLFRILTHVTARRPGTPLGRPDLARLCGCHPRTISRDLVDLAPHVPIDWDPAERAYVLLEKGWRLPPLAELTVADVLALALLRGLVSAPGLLPQQETILAALDKAAAGLAPPLARLMADAARSLTGDAAGPALFAGPRDYGAAPLLSLLEAAALRHTVRLDYDSRASGRAWRTVDPYALLPRDGVYWELHGWCHKNAAIRTFALDRVHTAEETGVVFTVRDAEWKAFQTRESVGGVRGGAEIVVEVRFAPTVAAWALDRRWPPGLTIQTEIGGAARLSGVAQGGVDALIAEILRWRRHAEVLGGPELRARITEEVRTMAALYTDPGPQKTSGDISDNTD